MAKSLIAPGQKKQLIRTVEDALGKVTMTSEEWQRVLAQGDELQKAVIGSVVELGKERFPDEEVESGRVYPLGYSPKDVAVQTDTLRKFFPGVGYAEEELAKDSLPEGAEAFFAIPQWQKVADTYEKAVKKVFEDIASKKNFYDCTGALGPDYLRRSERTERMLQTLAQQQGNQDILVVPAHFGLRHRGKSVRRARETFTAQEFGWEHSKWGLCSSLILSVWRVTTISGSIVPETNILRLPSAGLATRPAFPSAVARSSSVPAGLAVLASALVRRRPSCRSRN